MRDRTGHLHILGTLKPTQVRATTAYGLHRYGLYSYGLYSYGLHMMACLAMTNIVEEDNLRVRVCRRNEGRHAVGMRLDMQLACG